MSIKKLLLFAYIVAGLIIAVFTAFMTFYIIDVPIGMEMFSKIVLSISLTLPIIAFISYILGSYFAKKFIHIQDRLLKLSNEKFILDYQDEYIDEIASIHKTLNSVSIKLSNSLDELKEKNSELTWMVRSFAHDFRTPLTIIQGNIEAIEDGLIAQNDIPSSLQKIKLETHYMDELLKDVLSFIQSMKSIVKKEKIRLKEFISNEIIVLVQASSHVTIVNAINENDTLLFTKTDLKKILINLLDNAIKFTHNGTVTIFFENNSIIIQDTGIGIKAEELESIFKPFYTVDVSKNRLKSGFGLGLAIANNLALKNDYNLKCDAQYKNGCKMILS